jgi:hypothetical protein
VNRGRIGRIEMTSAGKQAQYTSAHLPLHYGEIFRCQRGGLAEMDCLSPPVTNTPSFTQQWKWAAGCSPPHHVVREEWHS